MVRPSRSGSRIFLELPPALAHYLERGRNLWLESVPHKGQLNFLNRPGVFVDFEALAVERRQLLSILGWDRARALSYRVGYEQGRRDASRHFNVFEKRAQLALRAGPLFAQLRGHFQAECSVFEYEPEARRVHIEIALRNNMEVQAHTMVSEMPEEGVCWWTCGYFSGHMSEIVGRRVLTLELVCSARGGDVCRFLSRLDSEFGSEADWVRGALNMPSIEREITERDELVDSAQTVARKAQEALAKLRQQKRADLELDNLVGESEVMKPILRRVRQVAASDLPVLLVGDQGAGRETIARAIHLAGLRKNGPFEVLDCVGHPPEALTRQLLGFLKGSFPGAVRDHTGLLARAHSGTLFINEVTALSPDAQGLLLRALEQGQVLPIGAEEAIRANVRILAATKHDLSRPSAAKRLREDLYFALSVATIDIPPLRERGSDILRLAETFLREFRERYDRPDAVFSEEAQKALLTCAWPGNVRQLRNVVEHAVVFGQGAQLGLEDLPEDVLATRWRRAPEELSEEVVRAALRRSRGNRSRAAELLGVGRTTLWRSMKRFGID